MKWFPIESNPDVMNRYMASLGAPDAPVEFTDVYGVTEDMLAMVPQPAFAVALVYPISDATDATLKAATDAQSAEVADFSKAHTFVYMKQLVNNACGTIAILHGLLNNTDKLGALRPGSFLDTLATKIASEAVLQDPLALGTLVAESESLSEAHASAAQEGHTQNQPLETDINLHFVVFVRAGDRCVELDGRQSNPILHGPCRTQEEFLTAAAAAIRERMDFNPTALEYGITALVPKY